MRKSAPFLAVLMASFFAFPASVEAFPIVSEQAPTLPLGLWGWRARGLFSDTTRGDRRREEGAAAMTLAYGARYNWTLGASLPFIERELKETVDGERRKRVSSGVGDLTLFTFYKFYQRDKFQYSEQAAVLGAVKLPTGRTDDRDSRGRRLAPELQPGTGSTDFLLGPIFTHRMTLRFAWHANLFYRINTEGTQDFRFGNKLFHNLVAEYRFIIRPETSLILELNGEYADKSEKERHSRPGTGGYVLFVTPGVQGTIPYTERAWAWEVAAQIPVVENLRGNQLSPGIRFVFGLRSLF